MSSESQPSFRTKVGPRGRVTIPVALQRAAGISEGDEVVLGVTKSGVIAVETPQAIKDRIRAGNPSLTEAESFNATEDVQALRDSEQD